jgi:hypothetical protein
MQNILIALNGNYFINRLNLSLQQTETIEAIKLNRILKREIKKTMREKIKVCFFNIHNNIYIQRLQ